MLSYLLLGTESLKHLFLLFTGNAGTGVIESEGCEHPFLGLGKGVRVSFTNLRQRRGQEPDRIRKLSSLNYQCRGRSGSLRQRSGIPTL